MNNENMNNVANMATEVETIVPEVVQEAIEKTAGSNHSGVIAFAVGTGTALGGYLLGKYVVEPVAKNVKSRVSKWLNSRKKTESNKVDTEESEQNINVPIPDDIETTHKIG